MNGLEPARGLDVERQGAGEYGTALEDAIHDLAQPLTALSFVLDLAALRSDPEAWRQAVHAGRVECRRAIAALEQVRAAAMPEVEPVHHGIAKSSGESW